LADNVLYLDELTKLTGANGRSARAPLTFSRKIVPAPAALSATVWANFAQIEAQRSD
jgi:hypothetical protein